MMIRSITAAIFITILMVLTACEENDGERSAPSELMTGEVTALPTAIELTGATVTVIERPTTAASATQSSTPLPVPSPTPTATIPPADELLIASLALQKEAHSYHQFMEMDVVSDLGQQLFFSFDGDYQQPELVGGLLIIKMGGITMESDIVVSGDEIFVTNPQTGAWRSSDDDPLLMAELGLNDLWQQELYKFDDFESVTLYGMEEHDGHSYYSINVVLPDYAIADTAVESEKDIRINYLIGVDDGSLYKVDMVFELIQKETGVRATTHAKMTFSDYNKAVDIEIPHIPALLETHTDADLGFKYDLPADWSIIKTGAESCAAGDCPELKLLKRYDDGGVSGILFTAVDPGALVFLQEIMSSPEYDERQVGRLPAHIREGENYVEGLLTLAPDNGLQFSGQWADHPDDQFVVQQILVSLVPVSTYSDADFRTYDLPGWASLSIPKEWHIVSLGRPEAAAISSSDSDLQQYAPQAEDFSLYIFGYTDPISPPLSALVDDWLAGLEFEWETEIQPESVTINEQEAATITYRTEYGLMEQATIYHDPSGSRVILLVATTGVENWGKYGSLFEAIQDSVQVQPVSPGPGLLPQKTYPASYGLHVDEFAPYEFAYPAHWTNTVAGDSPVVSPRPLPELLTSEYEINSVVIIPPTAMTTLSDEWNEGSTPAAAEIVELMGGWNPDRMRTSELSETTVDGVEYAAAYYVATDEMNDDQPIYGFMGAVTDGEMAVGMMSWVEDPAIYVNAWPTMFNSIRFKTRNTLDRESATTLTPGQWHEGSVFGFEEELLALTSDAGDQVLILTRMDGDGQQEIFDSWDWRIGQNYYISESWPYLTLLTTSEDEEFIIATTSAYGRRLNYESIAMVVDKGEPGVLDVIPVEIDDEECREYGYAGVTGETLIVAATPTGPGAADTKLWIELLDGNHERIDDEFYLGEGEPIFLESEMPEDGLFIVNVCERDYQPASIELILVVLDNK